MMCQLVMCSVKNKAEQGGLGMTENTMFYRVDTKITLVKYYLCRAMKEMGEENFR